MSRYSATIEKVEDYKNTYIPQANDLRKVALIIDVLRHSYMNEKDISLALRFSTRQSQYYSDALRFLDLIESIKYGKHCIIGLTKEALAFFENGSVEGKLRRYILQNDYLTLYKKRLNETKDVSDNTRNRRQKSFESWESWVKGKVANAYK